MLLTLQAKRDDASVWDAFAPGETFRAKGFATDAPRSERAFGPPEIDPAIFYAAAVDSIVRSVRMEIEGDLAEMSTSESTPADESSIRRALEIAKGLARRFARQPWIDVAGFVESDGRVAVLAHSHETGRRITFYVGVDSERAILTGVNDKPEWIDIKHTDAVGELPDWVLGAAR